MFDYIKGLIIELNSDHIILENGDIGYKIFFADFNSTSFQVGEKKLVYLYQHISEQEHLLFGFASAIYRDIFLLLISVSGIGPKMGMKLLNNKSAPELLRDIASKNQISLSRIKGLGEKTAKRLILELSKKAEDLLSTTPFKEEQILARGKDFSLKQEVEEVQDALRGLGYKEFEINKVLTRIEREEKEWASLEELLKICLNELAKIR